MKTRISYHISISPSYYVDLDIKIPVRDSICNFIGYFDRCSVRDSAWNSQWNAERLVRDFVRDYFSYAVRFNTQRDIKAAKLDALASKA